MKMIRTLYGCSCSFRTDRYHNPEKGEAPPPSVIRCDDCKQDTMRAYRTEGCDR